MTILPIVLPLAAYSLACSACSTSKMRSITGCILPRSTRSDISSKTCFEIVVEPQTDPWKEFNDVFLVATWLYVKSLLWMSTSAWATWSKLIPRWGRTDPKLEGQPQLKSLNHRPRKTNGTNRAGRSPLCWGRGEIWAGSPAGLGSRCGARREGWCHRLLAVELLPLLLSRLLRSRVLPTPWSVGLRGSLLDCRHCAPKTYNRNKLKRLNLTRFFRLDSPFSASFRFV